MHSRTRARLAEDTLHVLMRIPRAMHNKVAGGAHM